MKTLIFKITAAFIVCVFVMASTQQTTGKTTEKAKIEIATTTGGVQQIIIPAIVSDKNSDMVMQVAVTQKTEVAIETVEALCSETAKDGKMINTGDVAVVKDKVQINNTTTTLTNMTPGSADSGNLVVMPPSNTNVNFMMANPNSNEAAKITSIDRQRTSKTSNEATMMMQNMEAGVYNEVTTT